jgi:peptide/nickel transport system permease protein
VARVVVSRLLQAVLTLLLASVIVFVLARSSGNPADLVLPPDATPADRTAYIQRMGLDRPWPVQYAAFLGAALQGDFGKSLRTGAPATAIVFDRLDRTLRLATVGLVIALAISLPLGVMAAVRGTGSGWDSRCSANRCRRSGSASS